MARDLHDGHIHPRGHFCGSNCPKHKPEGVSAAPLRFVGALPEANGTRRVREPRYDELVAHLGEWAEWWGPVPHYIHKAVKTVAREGVKFEGAIRDGKAYIRAVPDV